MLRFGASYIRDLTVFACRSVWLLGPFVLLRNSRQNVGRNLRKLAVSWQSGRHGTGRGWYRHMACLQEQTSRTMLDLERSSQVPSQRQLPRPHQAQQYNGQVPHAQCKLRKLINIIIDVLTSSVAWRHQQTNVMYVTLSCTICLGRGLRQGLGPRSPKCHLVHFSRPIHFFFPISKF